MTPTLVFDIETIPDVAGLRRLNGIAAEVTDSEVALAAFAERREATGSDFLPHYLHRVAVISCVFRDASTFRVWSLGETGDVEATLIQRFFDGIEKHTPQLVSWNGSGFDLPVLNLRAMVNGVTAPRFWDWGDDDRDFRFNNYLSRYHTRHLDLMDVLAMFSGRASAPLDRMAQLCGFPGKLGMSGAGVWDAYQRGELASIRNYCETDVVNTWLLYLRFQHLRGVLTAERRDAETALVRERLGAMREPHWQEFLAAWPA